MRNFIKQDLNKSSIVFADKDSWMYNEIFPLGLREKGHMGSTYYAIANPAIGEVTHYYLKDDIKSLKEKRKELEINNAPYTPGRWPEWK